MLFEHSAGLKNTSKLICEFVRDQFRDSTGKAKWRGIWGAGLIWSLHWNRCQVQKTGLWKVETVLGVRRHSIRGKVSVGAGTLLGGGGTVWEGHGTEVFTVHTNCKNIPPTKIIHVNWK